MLTISLGIVNSITILGVIIIINNNYYLCKRFSDFTDPSVCDSQYVLFFKKVNNLYIK